MNYLIVEDGVIVNVIVCENDSIARVFGAVPGCDGAGIGDRYIPPAPEPEPETEPTAEELIDLMLGVKRYE